MANSRSAAQFAGRIQQLGTATERNRKQILVNAAQSTKAIMLATAMSKGVRPGSKIAGKRWTVRYDQVPASDSVIVRFTGPFHLVEGSTRPHAIQPKASRQQSGRRSRGRGAKALSIGGEFRASAAHPGTQGKKVFATGKQLAGRTVPQRMARDLGKVWRSI